ncbi:chitotriosidase-1 [Patella vulgata]|uniref:chitotriosidase-1 n=1 Tax=Patella vulgata TaxID=6465 RepID=UPI00217FB1C0|nr:chitotriosidase-1 [Patella vulgata]XP_050392560.1 chitotriosidase-1 [Patella vulgata]
MYRWSWFAFFLGTAVAEITNYKRVCYFTSWSSGRPGLASFTVANITDPSICTHYIYSFAGVESSTKTIIPLAETDENGGYTELTSIKKLVPEVKVMLAVGGWSFGIVPFTELANTSESIDEFCENAIKYLRKWDFDGLDLDWEYPTERGGGMEDRENFVILLKKLRMSFEAEAKDSNKPRLLLSSAVPIIKYVIDKGYDTKSIGQYVDFLNIMVYDLYGGWSTKIGHHAPLYASSQETEAEQTLNVDWGMNYWTVNISREKIVLGMPLYSRTFKLYNNSLTQPGSPMNGTGSPGPYTDSSGIMAFFEVCKVIQSGEYNEAWSEEQSVPYAYSKTDWLGYDNVRSAKLKANYVKDHQFGGIMVWELSFDDFGGSHCEMGKFPLLNTLKQTLTSAREACEPGSSGHQNKMGCKPCPRNTYQPNSAATSCNKCPLGEITKDEHSQGDYQCILDCSSGWEFNSASKKCTECPIGYYRQKPESWHCKKCEAGYTTVTTGSSGCVQQPEGYVAQEIHTVDIEVNVQIKTTSCTNKDLLEAAVLSSIKAQLLNMSVDWSGICTDDDCSNVIVRGMTGCETRRKRDVSTDKTLIVQVVVKGVPEELHNGVETRNTANMITEVLNKREYFTTLDSYMLTYEGATSVTSSVVCKQQYYSLQNDVCAPCPNGSYFNVMSLSCSLCGVGTYQDDPGSNFCKLCPGILSTKYEGSNNINQCISKCMIDTDYCKNDGKCLSNDTSVTCQCMKEFDGVRCEKVKDIPLDKPLIVGAAVGATVAVLLLALIIVSACACWTYGRRSRSYPQLKKNARSSRYERGLIDGGNVSVVPTLRSLPSDYYHNYYTLRAVPQNMYKYDTAKSNKRTTKKDFKL